MAAILKIEYKKPAHSHNIHSLPSLLPRGKPLFHFPPINILEIFRDLSPRTRKYSKTFHQHPKIFKHFLACKIVLAANHQLYPGNIQRPFGQPPAAAINSSNQRQQSTAATSISNQQQQLAVSTSFRPTSSIYTVYDDFR